VYVTTERFTADLSPAARAQASEIEAWLRQIGIAENHLTSVILHLDKPEFGVQTLKELFSLEDGDIDEILQPLPLAKRRLLKKAIKSLSFSLSSALSYTRPHSLWCIVGCVCVCVPSSVGMTCVCVYVYAREHRSTVKVESGQEFVASPDVLESRQWEEDSVRRKETETERSTEVARKGEEKKRIRELEEEAARITAASEEEVRHSKVEEEELVLEVQKLETLARKGERTFVADSRVFNVAGSRASDFTSSRYPLAVGKMEPKDDISSSTSPSVAAVATSAADARYDSSRNEGFRLFP